MDFKLHCSIDFIIFIISYLAIAFIICYHTKQKLLDIIKNANISVLNFFRLRINSANDLRSVSAKYHRSCYADIFEQDNTPDKTIEPRIINIHNAMQIIDYIDNHPNCRFSLTELMIVVSDKDETIKKIKEVADSIHANICKKNSNNPFVQFVFDNADFKHRNFDFS